MANAAVLFPVADCLASGTAFPFSEISSARPPLSSSSSILQLRRRRKAAAPARWRCQAESFDHIPKQFRLENLKDGLEDNYKTFPTELYGLPLAQMNMFMNEDNPFSRQADKVTLESISSEASYDNLRLYGNGGITNMYRGGRGRPRQPPPDLPSFLLDMRIVYLGMPIVPAVTELIFGQFTYLDFDDNTKPIYLYILSSGTQNENGESVGPESEAYAIADAMDYCKSKIYTINLGVADGQAAMLLSLGEKGYRAVLPYSYSKLYLPKVYESSGLVIDMWIKSKESDIQAETYLELLAKGTGKPKEEIAKDIQNSKFLGPQEAIEYGLADRIMQSMDSSFDNKNYEEMLARSRALRNRFAPGRQTFPSGTGLK